MDYIGDVRFYSNIGQDTGLPTEGSDRIGFHTAGSYNTLRPGYFAMLMVNPGWRGKRLGDNGESLFVRWSDVIDEYQRRYPLSVAKDIECLMKTPVSYAPAFVKDDVASEPLLRVTGDKEFEVRYWDNILETIKILIDKNLIPNGKYFYEILARFDQVVHSCPASIEHQMERSELIILDNRKIAHGRQSFISFEKNPDAGTISNPRQLFTIHIAIPSPSAETTELSQ